MAEKRDVERWYLPAQEILRNRLADLDVVHDDGQHQQAAEAVIINALAHEGWLHIEGRPAADGLAIAEESKRGVEAALGGIREHYKIHSHPSPMAGPSRSVPLPIPAQAIIDPALRSALSGQPQPGSKQRNRLTHDGARERPAGRDSNQAVGNAIADLLLSLTSMHRITQPVSASRADWAEERQACTDTSRLSASRTR
jgi:hypothetical protein